MDEEYPSNSHKMREASLVRNTSIVETKSEGTVTVTKPVKEPEESLMPKPKKAEGLVRTRKVSTTKQVIAALFPDGIAGVKEHLIWDVLVPRLGEILHSGWDDVGDVIFSGGRSYSQRNTRNYTSYSSYSTPQNRNHRYPAETRERYTYEEVVFGSRPQAEQALGLLQEMISNYGVVTVLDYNEEMGLPTRPTQAKYGWINLNSARVERTYDGWVLNMPRPLQID